MNRRIGWTLAIGAFAGSALLDPWILGVRDPSGLLDDVRMAARHAQAVVLAMAFLQLALARILDQAALPAARRRRIAGLTALGAVAYAAGYILAGVVPAAIWLVPIGSASTLAGLALLARSGPIDGVPAAVVPVLAFGMGLDLASGLFAADPAHLQPDYLGPEDGVRLRMLRLARAAAIALPVLSLIVCRIGDGACLESRQGRVARAGLVAGAAGMAAVLAAACFVFVPLKYLLPLPALATFAGTVAAALLADRHARPLERAGWWLIAASMGIGLFMGLYAFDGPFPTPSAIGPYLAFPRRLSRLGHGYAIVFGLLAIFLAREPGAGRPFGRAGSALVAAGALATLGAIGLVAGTPLSIAATAVGPGLVALGAALVLLANTHEAQP